MKILVTGASSHLARVLLPPLLDDSRVTRVVGLDRLIGRLSHPKYRHALMDVRAAEVAAVMRDVDAVVHLAFVVMQRDLGKRRNNRDWMRDINVGGTLNVFHAAAKQKVPRVIHCSSATIYDLATPYRGAIPESHPRRALDGFGYAEDSIEIENWLDGFEPEHPKTAVVRLRPHVIVGPNAQPFLNTLVGSRFYPQLPDPQPLVQCVHEDDVAQAIHRALFCDARGAFNLAPADSLSVKDAKALLHHWPVALSPATARAVFAGGWKLFHFGTDPAWLPGIRYNFVLHSRRARKEFGWQPRYDTVKDCLLALRSRGDG
jgi:UDP-glucose 4-epimerase